MLKPRHDMKRQRSDTNTKAYSSLSQANEWLWQLLVTAYCMLVCQHDMARAKVLQRNRMLVPLWKSMVSGLSFRSSPGWHLWYLSNSAHANSDFSILFELWPCVRDTILYSKGSVLKRMQYHKPCLQTVVLKHAAQNAVLDAAGKHIRKLYETQLVTTYHSSIYNETHSSHDICITSRCYARKHDGGER